MASWHEHGQYCYIFIYLVICTVCPVIKSTNHHGLMYGRLYSRLLHALYRHGRIQVLWGLKLIQFWWPSWRTRKQNYGYEIRYKNEYLFKM